MNDEYLLIGGASDGKRMRIDKLKPYLLIPVQDESRWFFESYHVVRMLDGDGTNLYVYICGDTTKVLSRLIEGYGRGC